MKRIDVSSLVSRNRLLPTHSATAVETIVDITVIGCKVWRWCNLHRNKLL